MRYYWCKCCVCLTNQSRDTFVRQWTILIKLIVVIGICVIQVNINIGSTRQTQLHALYSSLNSSTNPVTELLVCKNKDQTDFPRKCTVQVNKFSGPTSCNIWLQKLSLNSRWLLSCQALFQTHIWSYISLILLSEFGKMRGQLKIFVWKLTIISELSTRPYRLGFGLCLENAKLCEIWCQRDVVYRQFHISYHIWVGFPRTGICPHFCPFKKKVIVHCIVIWLCN